ncbi:MAG: surface lipoprotein assembly modifier [Rhodoferax sp.]|nr:surface lipoprotein assembly modifier [Rhodoferax sp.]
MYRVCAAALGCTLMAGSAAAADNNPPNLEAARQLLSTGESAQALAQLEPELLQFAGHPDYDYLIGQAWLAQGQTGQALFAFERVVMVDPSHSEARLKAAQILLDRGDAGHAQELLQPLVRATLDATRRQELARLLQVQAAAVAHDEITFSGYIALGLGWDDNVTSGPDASALVIPNFGLTPTDLGSAARDSDLMGSVETGVTLQKTLAETTSLTSSGGLSQGFNRGRKDMTEGMVYLDLGLQHRRDNEIFGAMVMAQEYLMGESVYRHSQSARLSWRHQMERTSALTGYVQHLKFDFPENAIDNASRTVSGLMQDGATGERRWRYGFYAGKEVSQDDIRPHFSYRLWGVHLGGTLPVNDKLSWSIAAAYEERRHLATDALYFVTRLDTTHSLGIAADYQLSPHWHLSPRVTYTRNVSNLALYDYTRNTFALQLRWEY